MKVERLEYKYCPECGTVYRDDKERPAPARCDTDEAKVVPVYAVFDEIIAVNARTGLVVLFDADGAEVGAQG